MTQPTYTDTDRRSTLLIVRVIWIALVLTQLGFGSVVVATVLSAGGDASGGGAATSGGGQSQLSGQMLAIGVGVLIGAVGMGYFIRNQSYKKHWQGHAVTPPGYFQGNLVLLALLEMASFVVLVFVLISGKLFPVVLPAVASLAVQCVNFPVGTPMDEALPEMVRDDT